MSERPMILVVIKTLGVGGAERLLAQAAPLWAQSQKFSYRVCHLSSPSDLAAPIRSAGVETACAGFRGSWPSPAAFTKLKKEVAGASLVHAHLPLAGVFVQSSRPRVPIIYTEHTLRSSYHPLTRLFHARALPRYDAVIAVGGHVEEELSGSGTCRSVCRIENAVEQAPFENSAAASLPIPNGALAILFLGRLEPDKDPLRAIRVFAEVCKEVPAAHLLLAGEGRLRPACKTLVQKAGLAGRVHLLGRRDDVPALLSRAAIVLNTSRIEGQPLSLLEAQAAGRPIVAPDLGGVPEIVGNNESGFLYPAGDEGACAHALLDLLGSGSLRERMGTAAKRCAAQRPTPAQWVEAHERLYEKVLAGGSSGAPA